MEVANYSRATVGASAEEAHIAASAAEFATAAADLERAFAAFKAAHPLPEEEEIALDTARLLAEIREKKQLLKRQAGLVEGWKMRLARVVAENTSRLAPPSSTS
eukprot:m.102783 g.102783  ORF g.102783 m.102783 type:complete len:104 (+) comp9027_c0_seq3:289-600(+)